MVNRLIILDKGRVIADDTPVASFEILRSRKHTMLRSMPTPMRVWSTLNWKTHCPMTVSDGRNQLTDWAEEHTLKPIPVKPKMEPEGKPCVELEEVWFRYEKDTPDILKSVSMKAWPGELYCILGGNGTGRVLRCPSSAASVSLTVANGSAMQKRLQHYLRILGCCW